MDFQTLRTVPTFSALTFPSPCGGKVVMDLEPESFILKNRVSIPLRGKGSHGPAYAANVKEISLPAIKGFHPLAGER